MIYLTISVDIFPDKGAEAQAIFQRAADYMRNNTAELTYHIVRNITGPARRVHVFATYDSIADWDSSRAKRATDPQWHAIVADLLPVIDLHNADVNFYDVVAQS